MCPNRLDPKPDPRYESKFRQQVEKEEEHVKRKRDGDSRSVESRKSSYEKKRGEERFGGRKEEQFSSKSKGKSVGDIADLRQALDRRRSDREE